MSNFPRNLPNYGHGFVKLILKYGHVKGPLLVALHVRLGQLYDNLPPKFMAHPVPLDLEDIRAIYNLMCEQIHGAIPDSPSGWGVKNGDNIKSFTTVEICRWALAQGLITESEFENTRRYMQNT